MCLGGFKNLRQDYNYEGLKMELDETSYEWGTCYEIEIETVSLYEQLLNFATLHVSGARSIRCR